MNPLLESLPEPVALLRRGRVQDCNGAFAELTGQPLESVRGRPLAPLLGGLGIVLSGGPDDGLVVARRLERWAGPAGEDGGGALDGDLRLGAAWTGGALAEALAGEGLQQLARRVVALAPRLAPGCQSLVAVVPQDDLSVFEVVAGRGRWARGLSGRRIARAGSLAGVAMREGRVVESGSAAAESSLAEALGEGRIESARIIPILAASALPDGRRALGMIGFYRTRGGGFDEAERALLDAVAQLVALPFQRLEYRAAADALAAQLAAVLDIAVDLAGSLNVPEVVAKLVRRAAGVAAAERAALLRVEGLDTVVEAAFDARGLEDEIGLRRPIASQPLMSEAIAGRVPVRGGRYDLEELPPVLQEALAEVRHTLTLPLVLGGDVIAVLVLSRRLERRFSPEDVATLQLVGTAAVLALRNAWLFAAAREASRDKDEFLNMAAHELRTPLTVITGYLSMLQEGSFGPPPPSWQRPLTVLSRKANELRSLVEDLLLTARLATDQLSIRAEVVDLREAALEAAAAARGDQEGDRIHVEEGGPVLALADPVRLAEILDQLLANALAYHRGSPEVTVRVHRRGARSVAIEIEDHGRGIAGEDKERIFDLFYRARGRSGAAPAGSGLGLHIGRELAARMGGRLELAWSRPGEGSRFRLTLPAAPAAGEVTE